MEEQKKLLSYLFLKYINPDKEDIRRLFNYTENVEKKDDNKSFENINEYSWFGCLQNIDSNSVQLQKQSLNYR